MNFILSALIMIGNSDFCVVTEKKLYCVDNTMNACLRSAFLTKGAIECIKNPTKKEK